MRRTADRTRANTSPEVLRRIDDTTMARLQQAAESTPAESVAHLDELDREWDTDRVLETESAVTGLLGLALGALLRPQFLLVPAFVAVSVLVHARTGRHPLMPLFRRLGVRTSREIARERYAAKALRGDFAAMSLPASEPERVSRERAGTARPLNVGPANPAGMH